ncbi:MULTISPECIES: nitrate reductase subunit alpha [Streptomyces]|uniref:Nitrate reductase alpha subunit n=2 Tax=Streptomyces TaxID=1883 RepID=A0A3M8EQZ2_9ACTN|nr:MULTISPECIES: nitrate reductase subunit alpha [Streptomyces]KNE79762.1 nitrate reductase [Streptomyces fradiae]OFA43453.1 nitrate reductase subunit alpha [Streptomyces fradiae]PQM19630.1 nitrate reductase subunit alpha [Streptomyces xinghaiensis]RKM90166.1 nitrate reductase subunit alpha [Streptomyces xinghaiensis]RNC68417.1 nitrate reductase subunit alpha [Streptomyces xinghaiensis]
MANERTADPGGDAPGRNWPLSARRLLTRGEVSADGRAVYGENDPRWEDFYRGRWAHDKVVRSTHGVNCTGSCSWMVYVKEGLITWEHQATDYPSIGADCPEYEPRGCPRGASFSWYTYSPSRVRYPYVRGTLLTMWREARKRLGDPVAAWAEITGDPAKARAYKRARGKGGLVRADWDEVAELIAAAHVHTVKTYGPDRTAGFSPIPAMSMASFAAGTRFLSLIGGTLLSFYDWYADLPIASPQSFGDQTDVPEAADWWNAGYLVMWGSNIPVTRTPDAHFLTEVRYRGTKVVAVAPDYADNVKHADEWLAPHPGTDGALAMAMGHVVLKEFLVDREVPYFRDYLRRYTDAPFLITLREHGGSLVPDRFLTAADLGEGGEHPEFKTVLLDETTGEPVVPGGSLGFRWGEQGKGKWNLELGDTVPALTLQERAEDRVEVTLPRFDEGATEGGSSMVRGVPVRRVGGRLVTTVFDLMLAQYGVSREGLPGRWPTGYEDASEPYTPAWQETVTSVPAVQAARIAREFARNAERTEGRSMIAMGAGTNHWFHSDTIYRAFLALTTMTGCQGVNGGGWAHYVGQEKVRPVTGLQHLAFAFDWQRPTRHMAGTSYWYMNTDQWRYEAFGPEELSSPLGEGRFTGRAFADCLAQAVRMGWTPGHPAFGRNPLDLADEAKAAGRDVPAHVVDQLKSGELKFAAEDPDDPANFPRVLTVWRANLLGSSGKGNEYFLRHLLGADSAVRSAETPPEGRPKEVTWHEEAPEGKLDLMVSVDFRLTSTGLFSDVVLPAATWYEKDDLSSTDMHPFVHAFTPAISPPWQAKTDYDTFLAIADRFSELAKDHLGTRTDILAVPLTHDTPDELAQPGGIVRDWKTGACEPVPGRTMPKLVTVERDYGAVADKMRAVGPLLDTLGTTTKGVTVHPNREIDELRRRNGAVRGGAADGRPSLATASHMCEAILALSGTTNGRLATEGFRALEERTGTELAHLAAEREGERITFADTRSQPRAVMTSYEWSGSETGGRRYSPFTINVEQRKPWHTLTGRQHFFVDHDWMAELGEQLPVFRPPLDARRHYGDEHLGEDGRAEVTVRYLTPHSKWSIHSEYQDNAYMLALSRGGPVIWMSSADAERIGVRDNEWVEAYNRNGVVAARAVVSHRMPEGTVYMYHAQDRTVNVPKTEVSGKRGGTHNALTRLLLKPSHLIGGYAQFTYAFNYYGPTGNQRDEVTVIRRRAQQVDY